MALTPEAISAQIISNVLLELFIYLREVLPSVDGGPSNGKLYDMAMDAF